jgi:hypothetical protein
MKNRKLLGTALLFLIGGALWACSGSAPVAQSPRGDVRSQTAGERFRERWVVAKQECDKYPVIRNGVDCRTHLRTAACADGPPTFDSCDRVAVQVDDPMATPEGRFAHAIQIPNPMPADAGYRPGMTPEEYFEHLCKNYAGEFIYRTADNVTGIRQLRLREPSSSFKFEHLLAMEDPYGHDQEEAEEPGFEFVSVSHKRYEFFERPLPVTRRSPRNKRFFDASLFADPPADAKIERYFGHDGKQNSLKLEFDTQSKARYAFTWRGILRPADRELGIAGGELIVLDTQTNQVMGVRRGFAFYRDSWEFTPLCPRYGYFGGFDKSTAFTAWFTVRVARTEKWKEFFEDLAKTQRIRPQPQSK